MSSLFHYAWFLQLVGITPKSNAVHSRKPNQAESGTLQVLFSSISSKYQWDFLATYDHIFYYYYFQIKNAFCHLSWDIDRAQGSRPEPWKMGWYVPRFHAIFTISNMFIYISTCVSLLNILFIWDKNRHARGAGAGPTYGSLDAHRCWRNSRTLRPWGLEKGFWAPGHLFSGWTHLVNPMPSLLCMSWPLFTAYSFSPDTLRLQPHEIS